MKFKPYGIVIITGVVIIGLIICAPSIKRQLNDWKLLPQPERLTELYFTHPNNLPSTFTAGQTQKVDFTVHNLEYRTTDYHYIVSEQSQAGGAVDTLTTGSFMLLQGQYKSPVLDIPLADMGSKVKISIDLSGQNESIDYLLSRSGA
jgi:uncharacterized membrane protein